MAFADIYSAVNAQLLALVAAAGQSALTPTFTFGPSSKHEGSVPPRVAWEFRPDKFESPRLQGGPNFPGLTQSNNPAPGQPRSLRTRVQGFEVEVWGPCQQFSPVVQTGLFAGTITPSGAPVDDQGNPTLYAMAVKVITSGVAGIATFQWSSNSGMTWSNVTTVAPSITLGTTGISLAMSGTLQAGDTFRWVANDYVINDFATTEWLVNALIVAVHQTAPGSYEIMGGHWENDASDVMQDGKVYRLDIEVAEPVLEMGSPALVQRLVTSVQQTDIIGATITIP